MSGSLATRVDVWRRISTLLFVILTGIAALFGAGLLLITLQLFEIRGELDELRTRSLPTLIRLSQLSQDASATSAIASALSQAATRSEFDTLVARIEDKLGSQDALIDELDSLNVDPERVETLRLNATLLGTNLERLMNTVENQIETRRRLETHLEVFSPDPWTNPGASTGAEHLSRTLAARAVSQIGKLLQDTNRARLARNRQMTDESIETLRSHLGGTQDPALQDLVAKWETRRDEILNDKASQLSNAFQIRALIEENALIANRLLGSASNAFWRASAELDAQVQLVNRATRFNIVASFGLLFALIAAAVLISRTLRRRVFQRLEKLRQALKRFAKDRTHGFHDEHPDEIGEISGAIAHYMSVIDQRESELAEKTSALEGLANQLAKYLSPQVYDSIFTGRQEVKLASSRKKLTIFFSDIVDFTETADRLESEELTQLLNHYLTEMSQIAFAHGATIDKYVGDAILVFFGDPETRGVREDALACVRMAMKMRERMKELQDQWHRSGIDKPLQVRMGIHTGYCTVGNFGSEDRLDYTIIGGAVNIASRLEAMAAPGQILISYETRANVEDRVECAEHGEIDVKGIAYPVKVYSVLDAQGMTGRSATKLHEHHAHFRMDVDLAEMSDTERAAARASLRTALSLLDSGARDAAARPEKVQASSGQFQDPSER